VLELPAHDIGEDLHLAVRVEAKAGAGIDTVLVDHVERAEAGVPGIVVGGE
jgi:hypothetical protein